MKNVEIKILIIFIIGFFLVKKNNYSENFIKNETITTTKIVTEIEEKSDSLKIDFSNKFFEEKIIFIDTISKKTKKKNIEMS